MPRKELKKARQQNVKHSQAFLAIHTLSDNDNGTHWVADFKKNFVNYVLIKASQILKKERNLDLLQLKKNSFFYWICLSKKFLSSEESI